MTSNHSLARQAVQTVLLGMDSVRDSESPSTVGRMDSHTIYTAVSGGRLQLRYLPI